jgi:Spy/CpxP family protein refolding chaperone
VKNRWIVFALIFSLAFNLAFIGTFGYHLWERRWKNETGKHRFPPHGWKSDEEIGFQSHQKEFLESIRGQFFPRIKEYRERLFHERKKLGQLLTKDNPDTVLINKQLEEIEKLQLKIEKEVVYQMMKEQKLMTPRQRQRYLDMILKPFDKRGPMRHHPDDDPGLPNEE